MYMFRSSECNTPNMRYISICVFTYAPVTAGGVILAWLCTLSRVGLMY